MDILKTASIGLCHEKSSGKYYMQIISTNQESNLFIEITIEDANYYKKIQALEIEDFDNLYGCVIFNMVHRKY